MASFASNLQLASLVMHEVKIHDVVYDDIGPNTAMIVCCFGLCLCLCCVLFSVVTIFPLFWFKVTVFAVVETTFSCLLLHVSFVIGNGMGLV